MRLHTDVLDTVDVLLAAGIAGVHIDNGLDWSGSRSRKHAVRVNLSGSSPRHRNTNNATAGYEHAATWDEWGVFLARLFQVDPNMHAGKNSYANAEHFHWRTGDRFRRPFTHCPLHRWQYDPLADVHVCSKGCGAIQRFGNPTFTYIIQEAYEPALKETA